MKKFKESFLREVLGFNNEEVEFTMEAQKKFPSFLVEEGEGFCVDGRTLYKNLEVARDFSTWIKGNLENAESKENTDYIKNWVDDKGVIFKGDVENTSVSDLTGQGCKIEYSLTLELAKEIAMFAGANPRANSKLKFNSKLVRKYFINLERGIKGMKKHNSIREPEKQNYNKMKEEIIKDYSNKHTDVTEVDKRFLMIRESNLINTKLLGFTASEIKAKLGYMDKQTREHLEIKNNTAISYIQEMITGLVIAGVDFEGRSKIVENICNNKYSDLKMN